jgi:hypothetical protein
MAGHRNGHGGPPGPWRCVGGELTEAQLGAACAALGVAGGRARRRRWQRLGLFPLPVDDEGASTPAYHRQAPLLAALVHRLTAAGAASRLSEAQAADLIRLLRARAVDPRGPEAAEDRFYGAVADALGRLDARRREAGEPAAPGPGRLPRPAPRPRWITRAGELSAAELDAASAARGVRLDRARRTYWQAERVFPQPERRRLRPPEARGGVRGYYHPGAVELAWLVDYATRPDHPGKAHAWRCSTGELAGLLGRWRDEAGPGRHPVAAEDAFYAHVAEAAAAASEGRPIPGLEPAHRLALPIGDGRVPPREREAALRGATQVAQAIADAWLGDHPSEPEPERLVVWFRLERAGPDSWRVADAGARRTGHGARRVRGHEREGAASARSAA